MHNEYNFPVTDKFQARSVTEPEFEPNLFQSGKQLYVDLDDVRGRDYLNEIKFDLGIENDVLQSTTNDYVKIIFSGHRGSGKTTELKRLHNQLNKPNQYASIFISIEEETEYSRFEAEDFYLLLITKLIERIEVEGLKVNQTSLEALSKRLFSSQVVKEEISEKYGIDLTTEHEVGFNILGWLKSKANFRALFSSESKSSNEIRREIKQNTLAIIDSFNALLVDVRDEFQKKNIGKDILYFIDGSEKIKFDVYERIFVQDASIIERISANIIMSASIDAYYKIMYRPNFHNRYVVPMIKLENPNAKIKLKQIIEKRIDCQIFIEDDALDFIVEKSGGCVRQLLIIVNKSLRKSKGNKITLEYSKNAVHEMGNELRETLNMKHLRTLKVGDFEPAEPETSEMLYSLVLLKYNGHESIKINPLLEGFIQS
jgi:hypothetical protein